MPMSVNTGSLLGFCFGEVTAKRARERSEEIKGNERETLKDTERKTPHCNKCLKIKGRAKGRPDD